MADAQHDANWVPTLIAVSTADGSTPVKLEADPTTGNLKVDASVTLDTSDIEIGAVELKNATTDDRVAVINSAPTTEFGVVTRNIPSGTQPVSGTVTAKPTDSYSIQAISEDATYKYFWFEAADLAYYILRKHLTNKVFTYTAGTGGYSAVYQSAILGPSGSPTFGTYGATF